MQAPDLPPSADRADKYWQPIQAGESRAERMSEHKDIETVTKRLRAALDALDAAVERRAEAAAGDHALADQIHALAIDRSKLAADLDAAAARSKKLETANREIADRLDVAISAIRSVITVHES
jgi:septal ring factor EnvC (AmiA/AmiB activator)